MRVALLDVQVWFVNRKLTIGRTEQTVISFLDRAIAGIHDTVLSNIIEAFFANIPRSNNMSLPFDKSVEERQDFPRAVGTNIDYYGTLDYNAAWKAAWRRFRRKTLAAGSTFCCNIHRCGINCAFPALPECRLDDEVSIYFLAFLILKVRSWTFHILFYFSIRHLT